MLDLRSGPQAPVTKAFLWCGWQAAPIDILIDGEMDLSKKPLQQALQCTLDNAAFAMMAMDCSTKSRIREIPLPFPGGPTPLRSSQYPRGLPSLSGRDKDRVKKSFPSLLEQATLMCLLNH